MVVKLFSFKYSTASCYSPLDFREKFYFNSFSFKGSISNSRWFFLLSWTVFPSDKEFIKHLKLLKKKAYKTLSQFFGSSFDDDDTASSTFLRDVNEDMCCGLPYTPLGWCIQDFLKFQFQITSKEPNWVTCQRFSTRLHSWQMCTRFLGIFSSHLFKRPSPTQPSQNSGNR